MLPVPGGGSPPPARHGLHHALNRTMDLLALRPCQDPVIAVCPQLRRTAVHSPWTHRIVDTRQSVQVIRTARDQPSSLVRAALRS
jgi:hypothetical protein